MKTQQIALGSITLDVALGEAASGSSAGRVLLVHGFTGGRGDFTDWLDEPLARDGWDVAVPDLRGHGSSDKPAELAAYSLEIMADDLLGVADHLGWRSFTLLGHSMGGMVAQVLALRAPERLDGLVLMDTCHGPVPLDPGLADLAVEVVRDGGMPALLAAQKALAADGPLSTPAHERLVAERPGHEAYGDANLLASSPVMYEAMARAMFAAPDRLEALRDVSVRTLVVVGEQDEPFLDPMRRIADAIPGARYEVVPDAGHSPQFENPKAWWAALAGFLPAG
jgi:pimeloyl-ACP methyl ester carboxylesterase